MLLDEDFLKRGFAYAAEAEAGAAVADAPEPEPTETPEPSEQLPEPEEVSTEPSAEDPYATFDAFGIPRDREAANAHLRNLTAQAHQNAQLRAMLWQLEQGRQQQTEAPKPAAESKPKLPWELPKFDPRLKQQLVYDTEGNLTVRPGGPPNLVAEYQQYQQAREDAIDKFLADPYTVMQEGLMPLIRAEAERIAQQQFQNQQTQSAESAFQQRLQGYYQQNKQWLEDSVTGQPTQWAWTWGNAIKQARAMGHPDPLGYADQVIDAELFRFQQSQEADKPEPKNGQAAQMAFLKAKNKPGRAGAQSRPNGKKSPSPDADPFARLRSDLEKLHAHNPDDFND